MVFRPTVIWDDKDVILVDTGYPGHLEDIKNHLEKLPTRRISKIIITHHDYDHLGSLFELVSGFDHHIEVYAHELTKPYIQGEQPLIKTGITVPRNSGRLYDYRWSGITILWGNYGYFHSWAYSGSYKLVPSFYENLNYWRCTHCRSRTTTISE